MRWHGDERGRGVADAAAFAGGAGELVDAMRAEGWVAEQPEFHLLPHIVSACNELPFELRETRTLEDGSFVLELVWTGADAGRGAVRRAVFELIGWFAETATYVRQREAEGGLTFEVVTGLLGDNAHFEPHGHAVRLNVRVG